MKRFCSLALLVAFLWTLPTRADSQPGSDSDSNEQAPPLTEYGRIEILRALSAERVYIRKTFPRGKKGLTLSVTGKLTPDERELAQLIADHGVAVKPGDLAVISNVQFKERSIIFEINGGPSKRRHWWEHLQIGGAVTVTPGPGRDKWENAIGSYVALEFPRYVPELKAYQIKALLAPVFDFNPHSAAEAYADSLTPKVRDAIKQHQVLVGMDRDMVIAALGKPRDKIREKDETGRQYEEWIYGEPPQDVQFVRFVGDEVVRLEIMQVNGEKTVRTQREVEPRPVAAHGATPPASSPAQPAVPSLRRPGEASSDKSQPTVVVPVVGPGSTPHPASTSPTTNPNGPAPGQAPPPDGPN